MELTKKRIIEIVVAILIVVIAGVVIGYKMHASSFAAKEMALMDEVKAVRQSVQLYFVLNKQYPPDLKTLTTEKYTLANRRGLYLTGIRVDKENFPIDSFNNRFIYEPASGKVAINSTNKKYETW